MQCPNCSIAFHAHWETFDIEDSAAIGTRWDCSVTVCPQCNYPCAEFTRFGPANPDDGVLEYVTERVSAYPETSAVIEVSEHVPTNLTQDYKEAYAVLPHSAKASAALSRRVLQVILREQGYDERDLAQQITSVLGEKRSDKVLPTSLRNHIDAIRNFGNFSAHPVTDVTTLQVIDVEPEEARWCLEIVERLFDHY